MNEGLIKIAEGYEMIAAGIRQIALNVEKKPQTAVSRAKTGKKPDTAAKEVSSTDMKKDEPQVDRRTVRAFLTEKSRAGKTSEVKNLITGFGYDKLSDVPDEKLGELYQKAQVL